MTYIYKLSYSTLFNPEEEAVCISETMTTLPKFTCFKDPGAE
jgi:hypothetical protein